MLMFLKFPPNVICVIMMFFESYEDPQQQQQQPEQPITQVFKSTAPRIQRTLQFFRLREAGQLTAQIARTDTTDQATLFEKYGLNHDVYLVHRDSDTLLRIRFTPHYTAYQRNIIASFATSASTNDATWVSIDANVDANIPKNQPVMFDEIDYLPALHSITQSIQYAGISPFRFSDMTCIVPELTIPLPVISSSVSVNLTIQLQNNTVQKVTLKITDTTNNQKFFIQVTNASAIEIFNVSGNVVMVKDVDVMWDIPSIYASTVPFSTFNEFNTFLVSNSFTCPGRLPEQGVETNVVTFIESNIIKPFIAQCEQIIAQGDAALQRAITSTQNDVCDDSTAQWAPPYANVKDCITRLKEGWTGRVRVVDNVHIDGAKMCHNSRYGSILVVDLSDPRSRGEPLLRIRVLRELARFADPLWGIKAIDNNSTTWRETWTMFQNIATNTLNWKLQ